MVAFFNFELLLINDRRLHGFPGMACAAAFVLLVFVDNDMLRKGGC